MAPVVAEIALENKDTFIVGKLDMDENLDSVRKYKPNGHPVYVVFQNGKEVERIRGRTAKDVFLQKVLDAIN